MTFFSPHIKLPMILSGWNNDNFLELLGQGRSAMADANNEYYKHKLLKQRTASIERRLASLPNGRRNTTKGRKIKLNQKAAMQLLQRIL
eukprot:7767173-Ditylum_brightwellii.AAC.1